MDYFHACIPVTFYLFWSTDAGSVFRVIGKDKGEFGPSGANGFRQGLVKPQDTAVLVYFYGLFYGHGSSIERNERPVKEQ
jgi:hypothetical protein